MPPVRWLCEGRARGVYGMAAHYAREQQAFGAATPYYGWLYPPNFLLVAAPLATCCPIRWPWRCGKARRLALYLAVIAAILRTPARRATIAQAVAAGGRRFPAVFVNLGHGQNGFLTAALLGGTAGVAATTAAAPASCSALLAYKPQFALVMPFALSRRGTMANDPRCRPPP